MPRTFTRTPRPGPSISSCASVMQRAVLGWLGPAARASALADLVRQAIVTLVSPIARASALADLVRQATVTLVSRFARASALADLVRKAAVTWVNSIARASALADLVRRAAVTRVRPLAICAAALPRAAVGWFGGVARASAGAARSACAAFLSRLLAGVVASLALACRALRRHVLSVVLTALLLTLSAGLAGVSVPLALLLWVLASLLSLVIWRACEPFLLHRLGCRPPTYQERERLDMALPASGLDVQVLDAPEPWLLRGLRTVVVTGGLLDLLEDRALVGLLTQAALQVRGASLPGELVVWLGNLPLLGAWCLGRGVLRLGRFVAFEVGATLVLPLVLWPEGFIRWPGRLFGMLILVLLGSALLSSGLSAAGLGLLLAWLVVPGLRRLLYRDRSRAEVAADDATLESGRGWELLEALQTLTWAASVAPPAGPLAWLSRTSTPLTERVDRTWRKLAQD